jgi:hypothetical protein
VSAVKEIEAVIKRGIALFFKACILLLKAITERLFFLRDPVVTLSTLQGWRYPVFLINSLASASTVGVHWRDVSNAYQILPIELFFFRLRISSFLPPPRRGILIYDREFGRQIACKKNVSIDKKYYLTPYPPDSYVYPYFAPPTFYLKRLSKLARRLSKRSGPRPIKLFFAGADHKEGYSPVARFMMLTRSTIIEHVVESLARPKYDNLKTKTKIIVTRDFFNDIAKHKMSPKEFLRNAALSDFFLCPPGWAIPHCHNIVEAMSVGSIPITNYSNYMSPPLSHGINCLSFDSLEDLTAVLDYISSIEYSDIERMREGVVRYYSTFLDANNAGKRFLERAGEISTLLVNDEKVSEYCDELERSMQEIPMQKLLSTPARS